MDRGRGQAPVAWVHAGARVAAWAVLAACTAEPGPNGTAGAPSVEQAGAAVAPACRAPGAEVALDHVVFVVGDLAAATDSFRAAGYRIKPGRLHPDGLLNAHVKFPTAQEVELMSLAGPPGGPIADGYARLLAEGEGGAYVALAAPDLDRVADRATALGLPTERPASGAARFVSFPADPAAGAVFFAGRSTVIDPDSMLTHPNGASGIEEVWIEGGPALVELLQGLGAVPCTAPPGGARPARRLALANGTVVVVDTPPGTTARALAARLSVGGRDRPRWVGPPQPGAGTPPEG